jgi:hypothetical protein
VLPPGAAIALFMPWCQFKRGNIIVDFFTAKASDHDQHQLDRFGALLLAWSWPSGLACTVGGLNAFRHPVWHDDAGLSGVDRLYVCMVPPTRSHRCHRAVVKACAWL